MRNWLRGKYGKSFIEVESACAKGLRKERAGILGWLESRMWVALDDAGEARAPLGTAFGTLARVWIFF